MIKIPFRQRCLSAPLVRDGNFGGGFHDRPYVGIRVGDDMFWCGAARKPAGNFDRQVEAVAFHDPVTGQRVLGVGVQAVSDERQAALYAKPPGVQRRSHARAAIDSPDSTSSLLTASIKAPMAAKSSGDHAGRSLAWPAIRHNPAATRRSRSCISFTSPL